MTMTQSAGNEESCYWVIDHLQEFLHGEMSEHDADAFRRHIAACENCMDEADTVSYTHLTLPTICSV